MKCLRPFRAVTSVNQKDNIPAITNQAQVIDLLIVKFINTHIIIAIKEHTFKIFRSK